MNLPLEEALFALALSKPTAERSAFLARECGGDGALRQRIEQLLAAHERLDPSPKPPVELVTATVVLPLEEGPGTQIGHYKLLEKIGEGGFGTVYVAEQREPVKRRVALKIIKLGMDTRQVVARFEAERQALAMMDHPNIAKVLDAGATDTGRPFFVMELVKGIPITKFCEQEKTATAEKLNLFIQVCHAIQHAHQKGIIHRDIKPSNILVTLHDPDRSGVPKVIDFGIAKATQAELTEKTVYTQFQQFIGTPAYMSPEQAEMSGLDIDTRSDIYSLGVLLYELLTGSTPFDTKELMQSGLDEMRKIIREREPVRPSTRLTQQHRLGAPSGIKDQKSKIENDLDWIVMKCLEKDRTRRYETANGLAMDLDRHLQHVPVVARPPSAAYRVQKFVQRNKVVVVAAGAVALVLVLGVLASSWQAVRARAEAARADQNADKANLSAREADEARQKEAQLRQAAQAQAYAADMNLIQQALALNNRGKAVELLDRHRPKAGDPDLRRWEWRYLWGQCQSERHTSLPSRPGGIWSLAASSDGRWLAVGEQVEGRLSIWDRQTSTQIALHAGLASVRVAFSPAAALLAFSLQPTNGADHVHLWEAATRNVVAKDLPLGGECLGLAFSQDGQRLITYAATPTNEVALWRVSDGVKLAGYPVPPFDNYGGMHGTPFAAAPSLSVAAVAPSNTIHLLDLSTGRVRWSAKPTREAVKALSLSPDGKTLASASGFVESDVHLWDVASGGELPRLQGHRAWVSGLVFWPDSKQLASASADQTVRLWDLTDRSNVPPARVLHGHNLEVWRVALLPDARTLVSGSKDGSVYLWNTAAIERKATLATLPADVAAWRFATDSQSVFTLDTQGSVAQWKGAHFQDREPLMSVGGAIPRLSWLLYRACFSRDGALLALGSTNGNLQVWDVRARALLHEQRVSTAALEPVQFHAERNSLVLVCRDEGSPGEVSFQEWGLVPWRKIAAWHGPKDMPNFALSPDGRWCLTFGQDAGVLRDVQTGNERTLRVAMKRADNATFAPDGRFFGIGSSFGHAKVWETADLAEVMTVHGLLMGLHSVAFSPDGKRVVTGSTATEAIKLWELDSHLDLLTLAGHGSLFHQTAFSPDGNVLGSINIENVLHLWRAPSWADIEAAEAQEQKEAQAQ